MKRKTQGRIAVAVAVLALPVGSTIAAGVTEGGGAAGGMALTWLGIAATAGLVSALLIWGINRMTD